VPITSIHHEKISRKKTTTRHISKILHHHEPRPFSSFLHKLITIPLNDKRQTSNGF
jgi:hypothetical protein